MRTRARGYRGNLPPCPVHHSVPTALPRKMTKRSTNHEDLAVPRTRRIANAIALSNPNRFTPNWPIVPLRESAFAERYANASPISHTTNDNRRTYARSHPRDFCVASSRRSQRFTAIFATHRVVSLRGFTISCLSPLARCEVLLEIVNFVTIGTWSLYRTSILDGYNNNKIRVILQVACDPKKFTVLSQ